MWCVFALSFEARLIIVLEELAVKRPLAGSFSALICSERLTRSLDLLYSVPFNRLGLPVA